MNDELIIQLSDGKTYLYSRQTGTDILKKNAKKEVKLVQGA